MTSDLSCEKHIQMLGIGESVKLSNKRPRKEVERLGVVPLSKEASKALGKGPGDKNWKPSKQPKKVHVEDGASMASMEDAMILQNFITEVSDIPSLDELQAENAMLWATNKTLSTNNAELLKRLTKAIQEKKALKETSEKDEDVLFRTIGSLQTTITNDKAAITKLEAEKAKLLKTVKGFAQILETGCNNLRIVGGDKEKQYAQYEQHWEFFKRLYNCALNRPRDTPIVLRTAPQAAAGGAPQ